MNPNNASESHQTFSAIQKILGNISSNGNSSYSYRSGVQVIQVDLGSLNEIPDQVGETPGELQNHTKAALLIVFATYIYDAETNQKDLSAIPTEIASLVESIASHLSNTRHKP
jgi:hypothetical protein